jgi:hypothetical protein
MLGSGALSRHKSSACSWAIISLGLVLGTDYQDARESLHDFPHILDSGHLQKLYQRFNTVRALTSSLRFMIGGSSGRTAGIIVDSGDWVLHPGLRLDMADRDLAGYTMKI